MFYKESIIHLVGSFFLVYTAVYTDWFLGIILDRVYNHPLGLLNTINMLNPIVDSLESKVYVVFKDLSYKEVTTLKKGKKARPKPILIVLKENKGQTQSFYKGFFAHSKYTIHDCSLNEINIEESGWILLNVNELEERKRKVIYEISDPTGEVREISNLDLHPSWPEYFQIEGICKIVKYLRKISVYPDWTYCDLKVENEKLKFRVEELESQLKKLGD